MDDLLLAIEQAPDIAYRGVQWKLWHDQSVRHGQSQVDVDQLLLEQHYLAKIPAVIRLWQNSPGLVLSRYDTRHPGFEEIRDYFSTINIPFFIRSSGGTVVPHGPGVLNVSLVFSSGKKQITLGESYFILCSLVGDVLASLGINCDVSKVEGAFCDGRYNLTIQGRKVGGTAQRLKIDSNGRHSFLSHMCVLLDVDIPAMVRCIDDFYGRCGVSYTLNEKSMTSLRSECLLLQNSDEILAQLLNGFHAL